MKSERVTDFERFDLDRGVRLFIHPTRKFKTVSMKAFLHLPLGEQATYVALLPHVLALVGMAAGFDHAQYAVLIWRAAILMMLAELAFSFNYLRRYESERALERASNTDPLTGISNRRYFMPLLRQETLRSCRYRRRISLLMLDIDNFKKINDKYGHPTGDLAIHLVSDICHSISRENDAVARLGGEEFAVLLPETGIEQAAAKAEKIRSIVEAAPVRSVCGAEFRITVSIGVAEQRLDAEDNLIGRADAALYLAKTSGRNRVCMDK
jgi:diguanylate cyclase (GGDEF)-like protein